MYHTVCHLSIFSARCRAQCYSLSRVWTIYITGAKFSICFLTLTQTVNTKSKLNAYPNHTLQMESSTKQIQLSVQGAGVQEPSPIDVCTVYEEEEEDKV